MKLPLVGVAVCIVFLAIGLKALLMKRERRMRRTVGFGHTMRAPVVRHVCDWGVSNEFSLCLDVTVETEGVSNLGVFECSNILCLAACSYVRTVKSAPV
jgi:hypothetical protein